ncbi:MAG: D-galactonate dehydratase family member [Candidatus Moanabacter tarae]|uniref:D-galactonate dehydratase family member n=1 Tax=Candidatus Moanibacter tarae TaxID=2200854 RepID=A0A2Z4APS7_9BACT|nr:MAG: D-galactonate dehydratase family member [Candidatus Moanabacter tarae]|tara:strand:+ start:17359 stop:18612 length:1254 start_codon:yes stop_codon:yes gene_type:complete
MNTQYLQPSPVSDQKITITAVETIQPVNLFPGLLLLRIHTDSGLIGHGETYYCAGAVQSMIHDWMARRLLGEDALAIESHWRFLYERAANFGVRGTEIRALSAIDLALWDILGQICNQPIYRLLGGPVRNKIQVYNSCGNPQYGASKTGRHGWPGFGDIGDPGPWADSWRLFNEPVELAEELSNLGYSGMKVWPFDQAAKRFGPSLIPYREIEESVRPLIKIRETVGWDLNLLVDGHAHFQLPQALRIADALREVKPLWLEDMIKMDNIDALADFRQQSRMPISASEMLLSRADYNEVLLKNAADYIMIDPTWVGGISETSRIANLAQTYNVPVTMHDCTGPLTLFAGLHVGAAVANCCYQETVRAHIQTVYPDLIEPSIKIENGHVSIPTGPGLGTRLNPNLFNSKLPAYRKSELE